MSLRSEQNLNTVNGPTFGECQNGVHGRMCNPRGLRVQRRMCQPERDPTADAQTIQNRCPQRASSDPSRGHTLRTGNLRLEPRDKRAQPRHNRAPGLGRAPALSAASRKTSPLRWRPSPSQPALPSGCGPPDHGHVSFSALTHRPSTDPRGPSGETQVGRRGGVRAPGHHGSPGPRAS